MLEDRKFYAHETFPKTARLRSSAPRPGKSLARPIR
jgi:hypothetical protein